MTDVSEAKSDAGEECDRDDRGPWYIGYAREAGETVLVWAKAVAELLSILS